MVWGAIGAVALGGAAGSALRYIVGMALMQRLGADFPYGTLMVNMSGCFLIGILAEVIQTRIAGGGPLLRLFLFTGVLGGYTTFSSFAYESLSMLQEGSMMLSTLYAFGSTVLGIALALAGVWIVRLLPVARF